MLVFRAHTVIVEKDFMQLIVEGFQQANRDCEWWEDRKIITPIANTAPVLYGLGRDVLLIKLLTTPDGHQIHLSGLAQGQRISEEAQVGFNETPFHFSRRRDRTQDDIDPSADQRWYSGEAFIGRVYGQTVQVIPALANTSGLQLWYVRDVPDFSSAEPYWSAFYASDASFTAQFTATAYPPEWQRLERCAMEWAKCLYYERFVDDSIQPDSVGRTRSDMHRARYAELCQRLIESRQNYEHGQSAPYSQSPFSY